MYNLHGHHTFPPDYHVHSKCVGFIVNIQFAIDFTIFPFYKGHQTLFTNVYLLQLLVAHTNLVAKLSALLTTVLVYTSMVSSDIHVPDMYP